MIDLHESDEVIDEYAQRYHDLLPVSTRKAVQYGEEVDASQFSDWGKDFPQLNSDMDALDRAKGALIGLAIGDAVGTTLKFKPRDSEHVYDMVGGGPFKLKPGQWTDDTSMAICLAEACLESGRVDINLFRDKLVEWYKGGKNSVNHTCFDIGNTTRYALEQYIIHGKGWYGNTSKNTAGNAGLIRQSPAVIFKWRSLKEIHYVTKNQSKATHCAAESLFSCQLHGFVLYMLLNGYDKETALSPHCIPLVSRVLIINAGEYKNKSRDQIRSGGYIIDTLEAAMWSVWNTNNFKDAILLAANLGDDAGSVAATAGQIAGALYGYSDIPEAWLNKLVQKERLVSLSESLFHFGANKNKVFMF